jgi:hypothetical protein
LPSFLTAKIFLWYKLAVINPITILITTLCFP